MTGEEHRRLRLEAGMKQSEVAYMLGTTQPSISARENGREAVPTAAGLLLRYIARFGPPWKVFGK